MFDIEELRQNVVELEKQVEQSTSEIGEEEFNKTILSSFENMTPYKCSHSDPCDN